jgi:hypothetical protein
MLRKVKQIKLGKQIYRRLMKRVLERDGWRCRKCGSWRICRSTTRSRGASRAMTPSITL